MLDLRGYGWMLWDGLLITVTVAVCALFVALAFGLLGAAAKLSKTAWLRTLADAYTTIVRGVPELILIILVYYGVPTLIQNLFASFDVLIDINPFVAGVATLGSIYGAFATEVFRGAFMAVPPGQIEAARAFGMSRLTAFRRITLPQVWRFALPGLGNVWLVLVKATALVSVVQLPELMRNADIAARAVKLPFTFFFVASLMYLGITIVSVGIQARIEKWAARGVRRAV